MEDAELSITNNPHKRIAVGYIRVSTQKQKEKGISLKNQELVINNYVIEYNSKNPILPMELDRIVEEVKSASKVKQSGSLFLNRPKMQEIIHEATLGKITDVIVYCRDRLNRNFPEWIALNTILKKLKVNLHFASTSEEVNQDVNALNEFFEMMMSNIAMFEAGNIGLRTKASLMTIVENGLFPGGKIPFGYNLNRPNKGKSYLSINEDEANVIKKIFSLYLQGKSYREILMILNGEYPNFSSRFNSPNFVQQILNNEIYTGTYLWNRKSSTELGFRDQIIKGPAIYGELKIISDDEFKRAKSIKNNIKQKDSKYLKTPFLLRDLLICGKCKSYLKGKNNGKGKKSVYYCKCGSDKWTISIPQDYIETLVFTYLNRFFSSINNDSLLRYHKDYISKYEEKMSEVNSEIISISKSLAKIKIQISQSNKIIDSKAILQSQDPNIYTTDFFNAIDTTLAQLQIKQKSLEDLLDEKKLYILNKPLNFDKFLEYITDFKNKILKLKMPEKDNKRNLRLYRLLLTQVISKITVNWTENGLILSILINVPSSVIDFNIKVSDTCPN